MPFEDFSIVDFGCVEKFPAALPRLCHSRRSEGHSMPAEA
jgi:hypothetical protein